MGSWFQVLHLHLKAAVNDAPKQVKQAMLSADLVIVKRSGDSC